MLLSIKCSLKSNRQIASFVKNMHESKNAPLPHLLQEVRRAKLTFPHLEDAKSKLFKERKKATK